MSEGWKYVLQYKSERLELSEGKLTVGRSRHCDLSIQEPSISRKHVFLTVGAGEIAVQDLGSSNGTFVNGLRVADEAKVEDGDTLRLGHAELRVEIGIREATDPGPPPRPRPMGPTETGETRKVQLQDVPESSSKWQLQGPGLDATAALLDDPDADPTKHLDSSVDWKVLRGARGGFWPRFGAALVDSVWAVGLVLAGKAFGGLLGALLAPFAVLILTWLFWGFWGTTPGKRAFGLYVYAVDTKVPGRPGLGLVVAALRLAACFLSLLLFGLGFVAIAFSPARLALHDRLAGTFVVRKTS